MARYRRPTPRNFERNPGLYARTVDTYTTRYYSRKDDKIFDLLGLNTSDDDYHKKLGSSPALVNVRYKGEREDEQRAQAMSRLGAGFIDTLGENIIIPEQDQAQSYLELYEGKAIEWELTHNRRLTGLALHIFNKDEIKGALRITIRDIDTNMEVSQAVVPASKMDIRMYKMHYSRFMQTVVDSRVRVRIEIIDDITDQEDRTEDRKKRSIRILSTSYGSHRYAKYSLPNVNNKLEEVAYQFTPAPNVPLTGTSINNWTPMLRSEKVRIGGQQHIVFPVKHDGIIELYKTNLVSKLTTAITTNVSPQAKKVRFAQAEGYLYYVDGISAAKRINLTTLAVEAVIPVLAEIQNNASATTPEQRQALIDSLTPKAGASLILFLQNRLYMSGFSDDPNLVIYSLIDDTKPRFNQYNDRFYSPDQSPELSAGSYITALYKIQDVLIVWRIDGLSLYTPGAGLEISATQATPEGAALGVLNQEAVCGGKNNVFFYNPIEGMCRFAGSVYRGLSVDIENSLKRIKYPENIFMIYQNKRVRLYFSFNEITNDSCYYYHSDLEGNLPWYLDRNTPVSSAVALTSNEGIIAIHSQVPSVMDVDSQFTDFDSGIVMDYATQYRTPGDINGWLYVRRLHIHEITNSTHSTYVALDIDHQNQPVVYRRFVEQTVVPTTNPDAIFQGIAEDGIQIIDINMYIKCRSYQLRFHRFCYKDQAELLGASIEYGDKPAL